MGRRPAYMAMRQIGTLYSLGTVGGLTDLQLLEQFLARSGVDAEDAFAVLIQRHGPMVWAVCRRMLPSSHDAEDAFQAAFHRAARSAGAGSIVQRGQLANWLHSVAVRSANEVRRRERRLRAKEKHLMDASRSRAGLPHSDDRDELLALLDEELDRLPERYRAALVLCELEGMSRRDAAGRLGLSEGTLSSRLARGRCLLRDRLMRARGVTLSAGAIAAARGGTNRERYAGDACGIDGEDCPDVRGNCGWCDPGRRRQASPINRPQHAALQAEDRRDGDCSGTRRTRNRNGSPPRWAAAADRGPYGCSPKGRARSQRQHRRARTGRSNRTRTSCSPPMHGAAATNTNRPTSIDSSPTIPPEGESWTNSRTTRSGSSGLSRRSWVRSARGCAGR